MSTLSQQLADLHVSSILIFAVILSIVRLGLIKHRSATARAVVELADAAMFASVLMFMVVLPFVVKSFYIPSGSMRETLVDNDHILVNKFLYRVAKPHSGDVVVFTAPSGALKLTNESNDPSGPPIDYIKRLIGEPGDIITVHHGYVDVGSASYTHREVRDKLGLENQDTEHLKLTDDGCLVTTVSSPDTTGSTIGSPVTTKLSKEELALKLSGLAGTPIEIHPGYVERNGVKMPNTHIAEDPGYDLKLVDGQSYIHDWDQGATMLDGVQIDGSKMLGYDRSPPGPVPAGQYLVFGDNRNDSNDGSRWGPLAANRLIGRAFFIFFPFNRVRVIR